MITPTSLLYPDAFLSPLAIDEAVHRALDEDLGRAGDVTSLATIPEATKAQAILVARQAGTVDNVTVQKHVKTYVDKGVISRFAIPDRITFVEALDKTSVGKIDKKVLRAKYGDG